MDMDRRLVSRRSFLHIAGFTTAGIALVACGATTTPAPAVATSAPAADTATPAPAEPTPVPETPTPVPTAPPALFGEGQIELVTWYQDWDGANKIMNSIAPQFVEQNPNVKINLQRIGYSDLFTKLLPSIAAGTEGDVMNLYTNWVVATDITKVFLDITEPAGGAKALEEKMWPAAFTAVDAPEGKVFYVPWLAGIRGAVLTVNTEQLKEKSIDYLKFESYEDVIAAGKALTEKTADGKLSRSGYSPQSSQYVLINSLIWQLGGNHFDKQSGKWSFNSEVGAEAAQIIYDIYWKDGTCDFELFQGEYEAVSQKLVSIWGDGAWTAGVQTDVAAIPCDNIVTPKLLSASANVQDPDHMACFGISRRLANQKEKLQPAVDWAMAITGPDATVQAFDFYSGVCMSKEVYNDSRISDVKYGEVSKRIAEGMWPIARYVQDHVADHGQAGTELNRAMRKEISIKEALTNMDTYLQEQEDSARERLGG
jgi:ABC-type glycerol-3-phosphate transport system substrate-binding protein